MCSGLSAWTGRRCDAGDCWRALAGRYRSASGFAGSVRECAKSSRGTSCLLEELIFRTLPPLLRKIRSPQQTSRDRELDCSSFHCGAACCIQNLGHDNVCFQRREIVLLGSFENHCTEICEFGVVWWGDWLGSDFLLRGFGRSSHANVIPLDGNHIPALPVDFHVFTIEGPVP